jgi:uncharacterized iron-regulated protein
MMRVLTVLAMAVGIYTAFLQLALAQNSVPPCKRLDGTSLRDVRWQHAQPNNPLLGQVFKGDRPIATDGTCQRTPLQQLIVEVWETIRSGGIVLLGEVHDNPEHHAVRADLLWPRLPAATMGLRPAAVFEHISTTQQGQIDTFYAMSARSRRLWRAPDLMRLLDWKESGWPRQEIFYPLFNAALRVRLPILPGNGDRQRVRALVRGEQADAAPEEKARLDLAATLPAAQLEALREELGQSHCGVLPASALPAMSLAQRYTDAHLADAAVQAARKHDGAFLLAGNGHVRTDRGVPFYVNALAPQMAVTAVTLVEVEDEDSDPQSYLPRSPDGKVVSDYTLFAPRHHRPDPCANMRDQLQRKKSEPSR